VSEIFNFFTLHTHENLYVNVLYSDLGLDDAERARLLLRKVPILLSDVGLGAHLFQTPMLLVE
jgi:hypothetical protein